MSDSDQTRKHLAMDLASSDGMIRTAAWKKFLADYSDFLYRIAYRFSASDEEDASEIFLFIIEGLAKREAGGFVRFEGYLNSLKDHPGGRFKTWLAHVLGNLCRDWHRARYGRRVPPRAIRQMGDVCTRLFELVFFHGYNETDARHIILEEYADFDINRFDEIMLNINGVLNDADRWSILTGIQRRAKKISLDSPLSDSPDAEPVQVSGDAPSPEEIAISHASEKTVKTLSDSISAIVETLSAESKDALKLWSSGELAAVDIAELCGLPGAQSVYRIVENFKKALGSELDAQDISWEQIEEILGETEGILEKLLDANGKDSANPS